MKKIYKLLSVIVLAAVIMSCGSSTESTDSSPLTDTTMHSMLPPKDNFNQSLNGKQVSLYYLSNSKGMKAAITNYGARVVGLIVPDAQGKPVDVVVGFDSLNEYVNAKERYFGAIVGRYGNRIAKGKFTLDGKQYQLDINNGQNSLHGGRTGFHSRVWDASQTDSSHITLTYVSADGEEGYPGQLTVKVTYTITEDNALQIDYETSADKRTVANITNHNFWNLNGEGSGTVNDHVLMINASRYNPIDSTFIPTGIATVENTPMDFRKPHAIGEHLNDSSEQLKFAKGYDHNFILTKNNGSTPQLAATIKGDKTGITMDVLTDQPGMQFYGGNFMAGLNRFKNGTHDEFRTAFCLETQHFPDSPNQPSFPSTVIEPGKTYKTTTIYKFH